MSVLIIRAHKRFAVRRQLSLRDAEGAKRNGLMIELSCEGCRISNIDASGFVAEQEVTLDFGSERIAGRVRWAHDGFVGIKFAVALRFAELNQLIEASRPAPEPLYGT